MPHVEIPQAEIKIVLLGSSHIGKSSLVTRFSEGYYRENSRQPTLAATFVTKLIQLGDLTIKLQLWDTSGSPSFRTTANVFTRDAAGVIVCYDVRSRDSFEEMRRWIDELREREIVMVIASLKGDMRGEGEYSSHCLV